MDPMAPGPTLDFDACYRAVAARDARFDGRFFTGVTSTGVYCRPVCPARLPLARNVRFFPAAAAAEAAGFRPCRRCRPELSPGAAGRDVASDLVRRALRLIADGVADEGGVAAVARRLAVSERHLHRLFVAELGAGPQAVARSRRAHLARQLLLSTDLPVSHIAFAAGFSSIRQCNETFADVFACAPTEVRRSSAPVAGAPGGDGPGPALTLRLSFRPPYDAEGALRFLARRAVPGVESVAGGVYRRTVRVGTDGTVLELEPTPAGVLLRLAPVGGQVRPLAPVVSAARRLLDLDADPDAVAGVLRADPVLAPRLAARPGVRVPGAFDGFEVAVRAVLGQQVTVAHGTALTARLVALAGEPVAGAAPAPGAAGLDRLFPTPEQVLRADLDAVGMPAARRAALVALATAVADGAVVLDGSDEPDRVVAALEALPGIGPWTASYVALRALGDPSQVPPGDAALRRALRDAGVDASPRSVADRAATWRPWGGYALLLLWG